MKVIHKYKIDIREGLQEIPVTHIGCTPLAVNVIGDEAYVWIEHNDHYPPSEGYTHKFKLIVFGTGWDIPDTMLGYIGTMFTGAFVWHVYQA